jgi:hypothetical protein
MTLPNRYTSDSIQPADDVVEYSSFVSDIDFITDLGQAVRRIDIVDGGSGSLVITTRGSAAASPSTTRTLTGLVAGDKIGPVQVYGITASGTDVAKIRVYL